jgi:hypothetical protein
MLLSPAMAIGKRWESEWMLKSVTSSFNVMKKRLKIKRLEAHQF